MRICSRWISNPPGHLIAPAIILLFLYGCIPPDNQLQIAKIERDILKLLNENAASVSMESIRQATDYANFIRRLKAIGKPPNIQFLNNKITDLVLNHLCNLSIMKGALDRMAFVTFDEESAQTIQAFYPSIPILIYENPLLQGGIKSQADNAGQIVHQMYRYQLMFIFRANLIRTLLYEDISLWMTQADSIWRASLFDFGYDLDHDQNNDLTDYDAYFDTVGTDEIFYFKKLQPWICGSTIFARANDRSRRLFDRLHTLLLQMVAADSALLSKLCQNAVAKCYLMPHSVASNINWFYGPERKNPPYFIQIDGTAKNTTKMKYLRDNGFGFIDERTNECSHAAVRDGIYRLELAPKTIMTDQIFPFNFEFEDITIRLIPFGMQRYQRLKFIPAYRARYSIKYP
ncbi:unnamed protein product [Anisakis simplex]|uniref:Nucleotid_trans domain-containing protein n=1 Tax=Anisakis simplex TaxID=6269 RepID=A0A0M3IZL1_ANISI|nr:unnamed protein product [Anisakis simplex]